MDKHIENLVYNAVRYIFAIGVVFFSLFPIYWMFTMSIKPPLEWTSPEVHWWPWYPTASNYLMLFFHKNTLLEWGVIKPWEISVPETAVKAITNSLILSISGTALSLFIGTLAAYAMSRYRASGDYMFLTFRMLPPIAILMPIVMWLSTIRLLDTHIGVILLYGLFPVPFVIWLMRSFFDDLPREIDEAAIMDGCTPATTFIKVILPLVRGGLAVTALFIFILNWSDLIVALLVTYRTAVTIPVQIGLYYSDVGHLYGMMSALGTFAIIPTLAFGLAIQRYLVRGLTFGAIKG
ncbi:MAG: carbohydrate ABC transporter permease [Candidatus Bathyarchaeia archaeon]